MVLQVVAALCCVVMLILALRQRSARPATKRGVVLRELLLWYPLSAPWLLLRTPMLWFMIVKLQLPVWVAVVIEFVIERPLFFLTAREITLRSEVDRG
jgi:hypothetical protein